MQKKNGPENIGDLLMGNLTNPSDTMCFQNNC